MTLRHKLPGPHAEGRYEPPVSDTYQSLLDQSIASTPEYQQLGTFDAVERMAEKLVRANWVPQSYRVKKAKWKDRNNNWHDAEYYSDAEVQAKVEVAIMHGADVGLSAIQSVQGIAIINNVPSLWGDAMLGLVLASGMVDQNGFEERFEGAKEHQDEGLVAVCTVKRKGQQPHTVRYSYARAKKAQLTGKSGPWQNDPARMLQMRARAYALRDRFADVLRGLHSAELMTDAEALDAAIEETPQRADLTRPFEPPEIAPRTHIDQPDAGPRQGRTMPRESSPPAREAHTEAPAAPMARDSAPQQTAHTAPPEDDGMPEIPAALRRTSATVPHDPETGEVHDDGPPPDSDLWQVDMVQAAKDADAEGRLEYWLSLERNQNSLAKMSDHYRKQIDALSDGAKRGRGGGK